MKSETLVINFCIFVKKDNMTTTYRLTTRELNIKFLTVLKNLYKGKTISITVEEELDETEYLLQSDTNRKMLEESLQNVNDGKLIEVDIDKYLKK